MPTSPLVRDYVTRAYTVSVSGSPEGGKRTLLLALCRLLRDNYSVAVVTSTPLPGQDGGRDFLLRHKALASSRIVAADQGPHTDLAIERLMAESRPELIFIDGENCGAKPDALADFTIHVVNGSGEWMSPDDAIGAAQSDLLVLNKIHPGPPLGPERDVRVRESMHIRGDAPYALTHLRYGIGTIEIARQILGSWRQTSAPEAWAEPVDGHVVLTPA
jgi:urease accessory protein